MLSQMFSFFLLFMQHLQDDPINIFRDGRIEFRRWIRDFIDMSVHGTDGRTAIEGCIADKHLIKNDAQGIEVGPAIDLFFAPCLFGRHVLRGPDARTGRCQTRTVRGSGNSEIEYFYFTGLADHDIMGLEISMENA